MKLLKNFIVVLMVMALVPSTVFAQNSKKKRCDSEDCVFEILKKLNSEDQLVVADAKKSLDSLADYAQFTGDSNSCDALRNSIIPFIMKFPDSENNEFLFSLLPKVCNSDDAIEIFELVDNESLADAAIRTIGDIQGTDAIIEKYIYRNKEDLKYKAALAYAVGKQEITSLENELISWLKDADDPTKIEVYNALLIIRTNGKTTKIVEKGAKKLYKSKIPENKIVGMRLIAAMDGEKCMPKLYKALNDNNKKVRVAALDLMKPYTNDKVCAKVVKKCKKSIAIIDVIDWLGDIKNDTQMEFLISQLSAENPKVVEATIRAVFKIDNADGINAVKPMFGGDYQEVIKESMMTYEGDYRAVLNDVIRTGDVKQKLAALQIIEGRPNVGLFVRVIELLYIENQAVRDEAYKVLKDVVVVANAEMLSALLENCDEKYVEQVQLAIRNAMKTATVEKKDLFASTLKHVKPNIMPRFYNVFAYFGTELCVDKLIDAYQNGDYKFEAKEALLLVEDERFAEKIKNALK